MCQLISPFGLATLHIFFTSLLQRLCAGTASSAESEHVTIELHDIPGGEHAFELCAKFCYGITINLSAHNFVRAFCAAKFLRMTDAVEKGNFVLKLDAFFSSCILQGWKDSIASLQSTGEVPEWSENLGIIRKCTDSIVEKILKPPEQVTWSFSYTRLGYQRNRNRSVPKDWWTEDISGLDVDLFRCIITAVKSAGTLSPQLIGEALHVYTCCWLPDITNACRLPESSTSPGRNRQILETIVSLIPSEGGSVSICFLLRLLKIANFLGVSAGTKSELIRRSGQQLEAAKLNELLFPAYHHGGNNQHQHSYDIELVQALLESFLRPWRRRSKEHERHAITPIINVGKLIDSYLQVVAKEGSASVNQIVSLAAAVPGIARPDHDQLYKAINLYLGKHPDLTKADKKQLCSILDCKKLSPETRSDAMRNERLPLRTVVQVLFFNVQDKSYQPKDQTLLSSASAADELGNLRIGPGKQSLEARETIDIGSSASAGTSRGVHQQKVPDDGKLRMEAEATVTRQRGKGKGIRGAAEGSKLDDTQNFQRTKH